MAYERDFKGIWIPKEVWLSDALTMQEKLFYVEIDSLDNEKGCFAGNAHFADFFDISKSRCSQIINGLESKSLITVSLKYKGKQVEKRVIKVVNKLNTPFSKLDRGIKYPKHPPLENAEGNNTSINNTSNNTDIVTTKSFDVSVKIADYLFYKILTINPSFKKPNLNVWAKDIDLAMRIDNRTKDELISCINWIYSKDGEFWQKNILSGKKLREKFDTMNMQTIKKKNLVSEIYGRGLTATEIINQMED